MDTGGVSCMYVRMCVREFYSAQGPDANVFFVQSRARLPQRGCALVSCAAVRLQTLAVPESPLALPFPKPSSRHDAKWFPEPNRRELSRRA